MYYRQLSKGQTAANNEAFNNVIEKFQKLNLVTKNVAEGLKTSSIWTTRSNLKDINKVILEEQ